MKKFLPLILAISLLIPQFAGAVPLVVPQGGTGASSFTPGGLIYGTSTNPLVATSSPTITSIRTTATSTFGGVIIGNLTGFLKATAGVISTAFVNLTSDVTGILPTVNGGTGTTSPPTANKLLLSNAVGGYDLVSTSTLGISGGGGSITGSGTSTQVTFWSGLSSLTSSAQLYWNNITKRLGVQIENPLATLHVGATTGDQINPPTSLSLGYTLDTSISSPSSASATQVGAPAVASTPTIGFTYIDQPTDAGQFTTQNTGGSGFTAYGQQIQYTVYAYRNTGGNRVANSNPFTFTTFTDTINDGTTQFQMDIGGWSAPNGFEDGYLLQRYDSYTGQTYVKDIGNTTSYSDTFFTDTDTYLTTTYFSTGASWASGVSQYKTINGTNYRSPYTSNSTADAGYGSNIGLILNVGSWGSLSENGFMAQYNTGYYFDLGSNTSYDDWGQTPAIGDYATFASIAFPEFNTSLTGASSLAPDPISYGGGSFTADGSTWDIQIWEYRNHPLSGQSYYVSSPATTGYGADDNSSNAMTFTGNFTTGDGDGAVVKLLQNGTVVAYSNVGAGTSWSISSPNGDIDTSANISSYAGTTRNFSNYGFVTSPSLKYSSTPKTYSFTDTNPSGGYIISHSWATPGSATSYKVLESSYRSGNFYNTTVASSYFQTNTGLGDSTVTPNTSGFTGDGSQYCYDIFSYSSTLSIYSATPLSGCTTLPNDSQKYVINGSWTASPSATSYKARRKIGAGSYAYKDPLVSPFVDDTSVSWGGSSTLTPTQSLNVVARFDKARTAPTDKSQLALVALGSSGTRYAGLSFGFANDSTVEPNYTSHINVDSSTGDFTFTGGSIKQNNTLGGSVYNQLGVSNVFNVNGVSSGSYYTQMLGGSGVNLAKFSTADNTSYFGNLSYNYTPDSTVSIQPETTSDAGLLIYPKPGAADTQPVFMVENSSATILAGINTIGSGWFGASASSDARLRVGSPNSNLSSMQFTSGANVPSTPRVGGVEFSTFEAPYATDGALYFTNNSSVRRRIQTALSTSEQARFLYVDGFGNMTTLNNPIQFSSGIITFNSSYTPLFGNGLSVSSGKDVSMGQGARFIGGLRMSYASRSTSGSINVTNNSPFTTFTGSTAGQTLTLPTAASISGTVFEIANVATVAVTINTTSSQTINVGLGTVTSIVMQPGDRIKFVANASSGWEAYVLQNIRTVATGGTGTSTAPTLGQILLGNNSSGYDLVATSSLGITSSQWITNGSNISYSAGKVGIGSSTPSGTLTVASASSTTSWIVSQIIGVTTYIIEKLDQLGHLITGGPAPVVSSCGTSPTNAGNDRTGSITTGSGVSVTACTLTFANAYSAGTSPICTVSTDSTLSLASVTSISNSAVTFGLSASLAGGHLYYICQAYQ